MAQAVAKGDLALTIDEDELGASLRFSPDPNGAEWSADKVLRLLMDARIGGYNQKRAEELVGKLGRAKGPLVEAVAAGQAPEPAQPESPEWTELAIPPELAAVVDAVAREAPPPLLYKVKVETVKVEKTVKKPAALPFLPPKVEKVIVSERRESREPVYPDPALLRVGYAKKGDRLCLLSSAKPGKAGKTIFGKPLQAQAGETAFFAGPNVARNKNELLAEADGAVRVGERWVDVVPVPEHRWSVELSPDGATFFLNYAPGDPRLPAPSAAEVLARAAGLGMPPEAAMGETEIAAILAEAAAAREAVYSRSISLDRDAKVEVRVSPDKTRATLSIWKGRGRGRPLELSAVSAALKASGVRGFKAEQLKKDVIEFHKGPKPELLDYLLIEGRAPGRGKDRALAFQAAFLGQAEAEALRARLAAAPGLAQAAPSLDEFPLEAADRVARVQLGQRVGELPPQQAGQAGVDIFGNALPGIPGNDPVVRVFEGLDFSKDAITATAAGILLVGVVEGATCLRVLPLRDASIEVEVAADASTASVSLVAEEGLGQGLTIEGVLAAFTAKGVVQGLEPWTIAEAVADARAGRPVLKRVAARARPARPGGSVKVEWLVHKASGALFALREGNRADFKERDTMTRVEAGMPLLKVAKAGDAGEDGVDVLGRVVKGGGLPGSERPPEHDATIREEPQEDGSVLYVAAAGGELVVEGEPGRGGRISVREHLAVAGDVGPETGNLRFPGSAKVAGSVLAGFSLVAGGDVAVGGGIEAALVSSDGVVRVAEGIKGARKGTVRAKRGIEAGFAEQALLLAVEDVKLKNACIFCNVKTNGRLVLLSEKGALIGGICRARKGIDVSSLGSENGVKTEVSFGQDYLVADQIDAEEREIGRLKNLILQSDRTMAELDLAGGGAGLDQIRQDKVKLMKLLEKRTVRLFDLREKFEGHVASEVRVRGTVHPGVILESHNRFFEVRSRRKMVAFSFDPSSGRIVERPLTG